MHRILHVDMDAFFASVELLDRPELRGRPVVVGSPPDRRGVVSTASYEARAYGIHSAMSSRAAFQRCPHAVFLPVRMKRYLEASQQVMSVFESFTPLVEPLSCDEAFLDIGGAMRRWGTPLKLARALKARLRKETGLTGSVGIGPNKFLAKLASDLQKPDGLTVVPAQPAEIARFLAPLPITKIWGVGEVSADRLAQFALRTIGDVQTCPERTLASIAGPRFATHLRALAFGQDERGVTPDREAKSLSSETTFDEDCDNPKAVRCVLLEQVEQVGSQLRRAGHRARTVLIKLRWSDFTTVTRRRTLPDATQSDRDLLHAASSLFEQERVSRPVRLVGFGVTNLETDAREPDLFHPTGPVREERLDAAVDRLRARFGRGIVRRGSTLGVG